VVLFLLPGLKPSLAPPSEVLADAKTRQAIDLRKCCVIFTHSLQVHQVPDRFPLV